MKNGFIGAFLVAIFAVTAAQAEDGRMSSSKLDNLGLASMQPVSDADGMTVRGEGRSFSSGAFMSTAGLSSSGVLAYSFANRDRARAQSAGQGFAVADYAQLFNGVNFIFTAQAFGTSSAFAP